MKRLFLLSLSLMMSIAASLAAVYTDENGVTWTYNVDGDNITIKGAEGCGEDVTVPGTIDGKTVTKLSGSFRENTTIKHVTVPTSVTSIDRNTFYKCFRLVRVEGLSNCVEIESRAFSECSNLKSIDLAECTQIGLSAFSDCSILSEIGNLSKCETIGTSAFVGCNKLNSVGSLESLTSIGESAFVNCYELEATINLDAFTIIPSRSFYGCKKMKFTGHFEKCVSVEERAFYECFSFTDLKIESNALVSIGEYALYCARNIEIKAPQLSSIGNYAFQSCLVLSINTETPPSLGNKVFNSNCTFSVPSSLVDTYKTAEGWKDYASQILSDETQINYDISVEAMNESSAIYAKIGEDNLANVVSLKVSGTINGYDIMIIRNKMPNLHNLDLEKANIVANNYEYYTGYHSEDNKIGPYAFYQMDKLFSVKLPESITTIGIYAFGNCYNLEEIIIPEQVTDIQDDAFGFCSKLTRVAFPSLLKSIGNSAFVFCNLESVSLPTNLVTIERYAFWNNSQLREIRIPSSITSIGDGAFSNCPNLLDVYTYTVEPTSINQDTFNTYEKATLHVPSTSFQNYYWNTEWSQFNKLEAFDEPYEYFYINKDYTLNDDTGRIDGEPDADLNPGSGLIVEGEESQDLDNVHVKEDGNMGGSIIGDGNINANHLYFDINIVAHKWYFMSFPYRIKIADIVCDGNWLFRYYDGDTRAKNASGGWKNLPNNQEYLEAGVGYIFRCNKSSVLQIPVEKTEYGNFAAGDRQQNMAQYIAEGRPEDASWNFMGNPYVGYFDIDNMSFVGPITVWDGTNYITVRPGDDEYHLRPFEAFFIQKPADASDLNYNVDGRHTYYQWDDIKKQKAQTRALTRGNGNDRFLINLTLSDGTNTDKTRVVFNNNCTADYEIGVDASKFMSDDKPQLYSLDAKKVRYAINELPEGDVSLGYTAVEAGELTIKAQRMDKPVMLLDNQTGIICDLSTSDYTFATEAGTFNARFTLRSGTTGIKGVLNEDTGNDPIYTLDGKRVKKPRTHQIIIKNGKKQISK